MWTAWAHEGTSIYYDREILTYQLQGPGVDVAAALSTPLLALAVAAIAVLGIVGARRGREPAILLPPLILALTAVLILFNKVGSPQFASWLAVPVIFGLVTARLDGGRSFRVPAVLALLIGALTQVIYPYLYGKLLGLDTVVLVALTARNVLYLVLVVWALVALVEAVRSEPEPPVTRRPYPCSPRPRTRPRPPRARPRRLRHRRDRVRGDGAAAADRPGPAAGRLGVVARTTRSRRRA